ncbi:hypothetical protein QYF36_008396 [Acer negundo]|nr:hypothetical protein QYF36_008396 [Acer negundo]
MNSSSVSSYVLLKVVISPQAAYIAVMRNSIITNRNGFEALLKLYREVDGMQERERILRLSLEGRETAWKWLKLSSNEKAEEVEEFFASHENPAIDKHVKQSIEHILIKARWIQSIRQEQSLPDLINQLLNKE